MKHRLGRILSNFVFLAFIPETSHHVILGRRRQAREGTDGTFYRPFEGILPLVTVHEFVDALVLPAIPSKAARPVNVVGTVQIKSHIQSRSRPQA